MVEPQESAVIVPIPQAEPVVGVHRAEMDQSAAWGVPAHVTVLYPFVEPARIEAAVLERLAAAVRTVPAFAARFERLDWFGDEVLWVAPEPAESFRALTSAVHAAFPEHVPYGGEHDEVVPHLTVAHQRPHEDLRAAAAQVAQGLPFASRVSAARLIAGAPVAGSWRTVAELPLG